MEIRFTYISGLEKEIEEPVDLLNKKAEQFFLDKTYSISIKKVVFIIIPQNLNEIEKKSVVSKYVKVEDIVGIKLYADIQEFLQKDFIQSIKYLGEIIPKSMNKNLRLKKLEIDFNSFLNDLEVFFKYF